jgi:prepilin-type N-terminal cleavage/methylation domain-containing protein
MKKLNNKGFSLVELIIVIAIMAILVGVVGTQVIPYLENSRQAKDYQILSSWNTAAMSAYSSAAAKIDSAKDYGIKIALNGDSAATVTYAKVNAGTTIADGDFKNSGLDTDVTLIKTFFEDLTDITSFKQSSFASKIGKNATGKADKAFTWVKITISSGGLIELTTQNNVFDSIESK